MVTSCVINIYTVLRNDGIEKVIVENEEKRKVKNKAKWFICIPAKDLEE